MRVEHCASYANCSSCLEARDPYCGWCSLEKRYLPILHKRIITDIKNKKKSHPADWIAVQPVAVLYNWGDFQQIYDRFNFSLRWLKERKGYPSISIHIHQDLTEYVEMPLNLPSLRWLKLPAFKRIRASLFWHYAVRWLPIRSAPDADNPAGMLPDLKKLIISAN